MRFAFPATRARPPSRLSILCSVLVWWAALGPAASASSQWVEPPGRGWLDVTVFHTDTREAFHPGGEVGPFDPFTQGHAVATSLFATVALGMVAGVDAWVQAPYHRLRYDDLGGERLRSGFGDTRFYLRIQPALWLGREIPVALRGGVKVPVGDFRVDAEAIPLGDGQTDWELVVELGHSFHPTAAYVSAWIGHRWREANVRSARDYGDEAFFLVSGGIRFGRLGATLIAEGWDGGVPVIEGLSLATAARSMFRLTPSLSYGVHRGRVKAGLQIPLRGTNLPAGNTLVAGYFVRLGSSR